MNKRQYYESRESIAYYSGLNGLEIKGIEYGINDYVYCVSGAWDGGKAFHRCKIQYTRNGGASCYLVSPDTVQAFIHYETWAQGVANCFCNITVKPYKGHKYNSAFVWVCAG